MTTPLTSYDARERRAEYEARKEGAVIEPTYHVISSAPCLTCTGTGCTACRYTGRVLVELREALKRIEVADRRGRVEDGVAEDAILHLVQDHR